MTIDLRCGRYQDVLADVECDALICDPPYSERTHAGSDAVAGPSASADGCQRHPLDYRAWTDTDVRLFAAAWSKRVRSWICVFTDDVLAPEWRSAFEAAGRYAFAPVPVLQHKPRLGGDGPGPGAVYLMVSRPREKRFSSWGSLPGWYHSHPERDGLVQGAKPIQLMRSIVRDYSRPGDLICDPCAGGATTLLAARVEGRRAVGAEMDPDTHAKAMQRIAGTWGAAPTQERLAL